MNKCEICGREETEYGRCEHCFNIDDRMVERLHSIIRNADGLKLYLAQWKKEHSVRSAIIMHNILNDLYTDIEGNADESTLPSLWEEFLDAYYTLNLKDEPTSFRFIYDEAD